MIDQLPLLKGGKIVEFESKNYKKGVLLNIDFETKDEDRYSIIAKYISRRNKLHIISLKENDEEYFDKVEELEDPSPVL